MENNLNIKIYDMDGGITWIAAVSPEDAIKGIADFQGYKSSEDYLKDFPDTLDDVEEISAEDYDNFNYVEDLDALTFEEKRGGLTEPKKTFREKLDEMIEAGETFPCFFATSEY